jgi:hypothetical protein
MYLAQEIKAELLRGNNGTYEGNEMGEGSCKLFFYFNEQTNIESVLNRVLGKCHFKIENLVTEVDADDGSKTIYV